MTIPEKLRKNNVPAEKWADWRWQLAHAIRDGKTELRLTPYLASIIDPNDPNDPIAKQHLPSPAELADDGFRFDEIWERPTDFYDGANRMIQQKYPDVILLRLSNTCHSFCRFCFQKERTLEQAVPTVAGHDEFAEALAVIRGHSGVRQVLVSGGDPLVAPDEIILGRLSELVAISHITTIRLNTRVLLHNPFRITAEFAERLGELQAKSWQREAERGVNIKIGLHFNHPRELTAETLTAARRLQLAGVELYNQTVLLKGVNDSAEIIAELFRRLRYEGIDLHYLSHAMPVPGTAHLRTSVRRGQEIMAELRATSEFRGQLPHYEMSHYTGKQIVPTTMTENFFEDTLATPTGLRQVIRFLSDVTGEWEIYWDGVDTGAKLV